MTQQAEVTQKVLCLALRHITTMENQLTDGTGFQANLEFGGARFGTHLHTQEEHRAANSQRFDDAQACTIRRIARRRDVAQGGVLGFLSAGNVFQRN